MSSENNPWDIIDIDEMESLANEYETPFYIYDADYINKRISRIRDVFENLVSVYYAVKANPNLGLLKAVRNVADGFDISSGGELEQVYHSGADMSGVSFAGPAKTYYELKSSIEKRIGCISIESLRELEMCIAIAKETGIKANIVIRINPLFLNRAYGMKMGGKSVQFGIDEESLQEILTVIEPNLDYLDFRGIHIYSGSQCFEAEGVTDSVKNIFRIVDEIESGSSLVCKVINLGGGFGVSHGTKNQELNIDELSDLLLPVLKEFTEKSIIKREIVFELGRYLTAAAGMYVSRVISSKKSRGKDYYMVDGGLHHHLAAAGTFGTALRSNFLLKNITSPEDEKIKCNIAGPSCNPTDLLGVNIDLPEPKINDLIGVLKSGSYGLTASPVLFLGRQTPAELIKHDGKILLGRKPMTILDFN